MTVYKRDDNLNLGQLLGDIRVLLFLYISFRLILLMAYQPILTDLGEQGIGTSGDRLYHYQLAALSEDGNLPFRDWWSEFPPVWFITTTATYLMLGETVNYTSWAMVLGVLMLVFEVGNLLMMRAIGTTLYGKNTGMALAWVYAVTVAPAIFMWWNFDAMMTFFLLLGLHYLLQKKHSKSAIAMGVGILVKFVPALMLGAVIRFRDAKQSIIYAVIAVITVAVVYVPLLGINAEMTAVSLTSQFEKASYQSVWALLDGNYTTGNFGTIESHFSPEQAGFVEGKNSATIPSWLRLGIAGLIGLFVFVRTKRLDNIGIVAFVGITTLIFYLQSQGWSPQWITQIIPLTLLVFPNRTGVLVTVLLSLLSFTEYPFLWSRTGDLDPPGVMGGSLFMPWATVVIMRTLVLVGIAIAFYQKLRQEPIPELEN